MSLEPEQVFEQHRAHLRGVAYRMIGSLSEAEDVLQEAFLRWRGVAEPVSNPRGYLSVLVTRLCIDWLKSARARRETYIGTWLPEPVVDASAVQLDSPSELAEDISVALLLALERLSPLERAAFLLHDVFDVDYAAIAPVLARSEEACRKLAARARAHVRGGGPRYRPTDEESQRLLQAFVAATRGNTRVLEDVLAEDAVLYSDGGGRVTAALKPIFGRSNILRFLAGIARKNAGTPTLEASTAAVNGLPGLVLSSEGHVVQTLAFEFDDHGILRAIFGVRNPEKLAHVSLH
ncbi:MAG TPA: RNA polymerase sigma factor SigJ [Polyangiaceae bacterium]